MTRATRELMHTLPSVQAAHTGNIIAAGWMIVPPFPQMIRTAAMPRQNCGPNAARQHVERGA